MNQGLRTELDAIELLMQDHRELESLFREFEYLHAKDEDAAHVVDAACAELKAHDSLKSEVFCPAVSDSADEPEIEGLLAQVEEGHRAIRDLLARVEEADSDRAQRDAQFSLLSKRAERQFELAETEVFPRVRTAEGVDLASIAERMKAHKNEMSRGL